MICKDSLCLELRDCRLVPSSNRKHLVGYCLSSLIDQFYTVLFFKWEEKNLVQEMADHN